MFFLAFRHLISRKRQTLLTLMGVGLGTAVFVTFSAVMTGFQEYIIDQLVNNDAHVRVQAKDELLNAEELRTSLFGEDSKVLWQNTPSGRTASTKIMHPSGWFELLNTDPQVYSYSPQLAAQVIFAKSSATYGGRLIGVLAEAQSRVTTIEKYIEGGSFKSISNGGQRIIVGQGLLEKLGAKLGDSITVSTGQSEPVPFKISGVFKVGVKNVDEGVAYAHLNDVQQASHRPSEVTDIAIRLFDVDQSKSFASRYDGLTQESVLSWDQSNANIMSVFSLQDFIRSFISIAIMIVASFGIYNILNIVVNQKRRDIGILRSMGYNSSEVVKLFLVQGIVLGLVGGVCGLAMGFGLSYMLTFYQIGGMMNRMIINFAPKIYISGFLMAVASSILSSILPARFAGKLKPIDIVRSGE